MADAKAVLRALEPRVGDVVLYVPENDPPTPAMVTAIRSGYLADLDVFSTRYRPGGVQVAVERDEVGRAVGTWHVREAAGRSG